MVIKRGSMVHANPGEPAAVVSALAAAQ
jgi:hypothetical protein